jgi:hypothetical protein
MQAYYIPSFIMILTGIISLICACFAIKHSCRQLKFYAFCMLWISIASMVISLCLYGISLSNRYCLSLDKNTPEYKVECLLTNSYCQSVVSKEIPLSYKFCMECIWGSHGREQCEKLILLNLSHTS